MDCSISDEELRKKLELLGEKVGPVTATTRRVLLLKLESILKSKHRTLNSLSSDESEVERHFTPDKSKKKRLSLRNSSLSPSSQPKHATGNHDVFKKPLPSPIRQFSRSPANTSFGKTSPESSIVGSLSRRSYGHSQERSKLDLELSDSDADTESLLSPMRTLKLRNRGANHTLTNHTDEYLKRSPRSLVSKAQNGEDYVQSFQSSNSKQKDWRINVPRKKYKFPSLTERKYDKGLNTNGYLTSDPINGIFSSEKKSPDRTTNYSFCISWMLVLATVAFFIFLGVFYISSVQNTYAEERKNYLDSLICHKNNYDCVPREHFNSAISASHDLYDLLSAVAGEYECQTGRESRNLSLSATKRHLRTTFSTDDFEPQLFDKVFDYAILLSIKNPDWGINVYSGDGELIENGHAAHEKLKSISALESKYASKSLWCRIQHSIHWTLTRIFFILFVAVVICLSFVGLKYWKKQKALKEEEFFELVEKILDVLRSPDEASSSSTSIPCKAVVHIRDKIFPLKERHAKQRLWERAERFIEENESRVQVDHEQIGGENFKVWRWLSSPTSETEEGKKGKVWQGQAFGSLSKGKNHVPYSPTPCLKIRNMFDYEIEYGDNWQTCIQDAILEKCEANNGIIHIAVDASSKEGCVYMLCDNPESAGKAYNALHGWWFDGKLVTVKFLRLERYLQRFPEAEVCDEPLKPSNNKRLSLSTPFFSSALERF